jgi:signal transduction histidine kinase
MNDPILDISNRVAGLDEPTLNHLRELQRFAEIGRLSASLLHEESNPLTAAILHLDPALCASSQNIRNARKHMQIMQRYIESARQQVRHASSLRLFFSRGQLEQVRQILEPHARRHAVILKIIAATNYRLYGDPVKFQQIVSNLVKNAIDAYATLPIDCTVRQVTVMLSESQGYLVIEVTDHGLGMTAEELSQVFIPFYTTKVKAGHGLGIGLTVVKQYIETDFGGSIRAQSQPGSGTVFTARFKLSQPPG